MIKTDANSCTVRPADFEKPCKLLGSFVEILMEVAGINSHFLHVRSDSYGCLGREMNIGHERSSDALRPENVTYFLHFRNISLARNRDADYVRPGLSHSMTLSYSLFHIVGMRIAHRLDRDGAVLANLDATDLRLNFPDHCKLML